MSDAPVLRLNGSVSDVDLIYTEGQSQPLLLATNATITGLCTYCSMYQIKITHSFLQSNFLSVFVEFDSFVSVFVYAMRPLCVHKQHWPVGYKLFI